MEPFKNFKVAAYVYAYYLEKVDEAEIQRGIDYFKKYIHLDKVYIENHRGTVDIPVEKLKAVKALFEKNGIETSGGITSTQLVDGVRKPSYYDTFCYTDPDFVDRARRMGHSVIVGGENYGQGSSREYAAMLPMCLGVEAVIAKSYARIHKENLFNYGILPLIFENPADYEKLQQGDRLVLENVPEGIQAGRLTVTVPERGLTLTAVLEAFDYDKNLLLEGGALNHLAKLQKR